MFLSRAKHSLSRTVPLLMILFLQSLIVCDTSVAASAENAPVAASAENALVAGNGENAPIAGNAENALVSASAPDANPNDRIVFVQDGPISQELHVPLYEWLPKNKPPSGMVLAIHGLTLHGKRYEVLGKAFAASGFYACAADMRGFGRCYTDAKHSFDVGDDCKRKVNFEKSYDDEVRLASKMKQRYPGIPLFVVGESLGTAICIRIAAEHPDLVDGLILSGPTVKVNPLMYLHPANIGAGAWSVVVSPGFRMNTKAFVKNLVSNDPNIIDEMLNDPLCRKHLTISELLQTRQFVSKTLSFAHKIKQNEPILVVQGSEDRCMVPHAVTTLSKTIPSSDQTIRWLDAHGHLLLETAYLSPSTLDAVSSWMDQHQPAHLRDEKTIQSEILQLGAKVSAVTTDTQKKAARTDTQKKRSLLSKPAS